ncbi:MAG: glycosyltransferase family 4 protein, partial [Alphaproteobacteria bacterium]|nr:glycosyltransferase family 4 protein [Alphaproteobacteria bacterium]
AVVYNSYGHILESIENSSNIVKKNQIIFAGKPVAHKGIIEFISALPRVLNNHKDYTAVIIGAFFSKKEKYAATIANLLESAEIKELISAKRIIFLKNLSPSEVFAKMSESKIAVIPTKTKEPFGLVCLEAHLAKCAVVSSKSGGLPEISGDNAIYLNPVSATEIAKSIEYLIENPHILGKLAENGKIYAHDKFSPQVLVAILDVMREEFLEYKN